MGNVLEILTFYAEFSALVGACGDEYRVIIFFQFLDGNVFAETGVINKR